MIAFWLHYDFLYGFIMYRQHQYEGYEKYCAGFLQKYDLTMHGDLYLSAAWSSD